MRKEPKQNRADTTRKLVLAAANKVILREGRDRFNTTQIAAEAGVSIGTIYRYFEDRVDILDALYPDRVEGLRSQRKPQCEARYLDERCYRVKNHPPQHHSKSYVWHDIFSDQLDINDDDGN